MKVKSLLSIVLGSLTLAACAPEMEEIPAEEQYLRDFIKKYGIIDPNQNWSLASNQVVSVKGASGAEAKIYVELDGQRYIVADYKNIADPAALTFDIPAGMKNVIVKVNGKEFNTTVGSSIDASSVASRTITEAGTNGKITWEATEVAYLHTTAVTDFINTYPEGGNNLPNGTNSFYFEADGDYHTFYPFYWNTNAYHCLGIYYLNSDGSITMQDLYYSKSGELEVSKDYIEERHEEIEISAGTTQSYILTEKWVLENPGLKDKSGNEVSSIDLNTLLALNNTWDANAVKSYTSETAEFYTEHGYISEIAYNQDGNHKFNFTEYVTTAYKKQIDIDGNEGEWARVGATPAYSPGENVTIKTRGIKYKLEKGTLYGFYIKVGHSSASLDVAPAYDYVVFSHSERNRTYKDAKYTYDLAWDNQQDVNYRIRNYPWNDKSWWEEQELDEKDAYAYASWGTATMAGRNYTLFGFEDCGHGFYDDACDLNDIMFLFAAGEQPSNVIIKEEDDPDPIIPDDPDDQPLTWTLAVEDLGESDDYDFNDLVLEITHVAGTTEATVRALAAGGIMPIYVKYDGNLIAETHVNQWLGHDDHTKMINTGSGATGTHSEAITITVGANDKMDDIINKFTIVVKNGENEDVAKEIHTVTTEVGTTPLMLLLPHAWQWPVERTRIDEAYPSFRDWVGDAEKIDWIKSKQEEKVYK